MKMSDTFIRMAIATGGIVPPPGGGPGSGLRVLALTGWVVAILAALAMAAAYYLGP
jgi:hypothetical protein